MQLQSGTNSCVTPHIAQTNIWPKQNGRHRVFAHRHRCFQSFNFNCHLVIWRTTLVIYDALAAGNGKGWYKRICSLCYDSEMRNGRLL